MTKCTFPDKSLDPETGLYYYGARYLDPKYSMWLSTDPALGEYVPAAGKATTDEASKLPGVGGVFNTVNLNLYHYGANNPVRYTDPDGRSSWEKQLFEYCAESSVSGNPLTQTEVLSATVNHSNQQFASALEIIQQDVNKGIVAGMKFMADHGSEISLTCYATGNISLGIVIDGISVACDVSLAIQDYQNSGKTRNDKIKLGTDLVTTALSTVASGPTANQLTKGINKLGKEQFAEKLDNMLSNVIGTEFDSCIDNFVGNKVNE